MPTLGELTLAEKEALAAITEWVACPLCDGKADEYAGTSQFCALCQQEGRVLQSTRNVTSWLVTSYKATTAQLTAIETKHKEQLRQLMSVIDDPDQRLCCNGHHCGCHGATVGQFAAWCMTEA